MMLWNRTAQYEYKPFEYEADIELAILEVKDVLFGPNRIYLDIKKKIGNGKTKNIPDGYLIDLTSQRKPVLYVVENELAKHDPLRHTAIQILEFSLSFETSPLTVKNILRTALDATPEARAKCEQYAESNGFENIDYLLEQMIHQGNFSALVIIDELPEELETILNSRFKFGVEVITLQRFKSRDGECLYQFEPFLADVGKPEPVAGSTNGRTNLDVAEIDTIVVPAREEGFQEVAVGQNCWHHIRIHGSMIPKIKHIAFYRSKPVSAITHIAPVESIEPWEGTNKYLLNFSEPLQEISSKHLRQNGAVSAPQAPRYTSKQRLMTAESLDDVF
jgi:hypothetical protein